MDAHAEARTRFRFGECLLDVQRRELLVGGKVVPLQPRAFDLLACLVRRPGQALAKESLIAEVWPTTHVTDAVLSMAVARIRKAIGDHADPPMLATLHGVGYRLDAEVRDAPLGDSSGAPPALAPPSPDGDVTAAPPADSDFWDAQWRRVALLESSGNAQEALRLLRLLPPRAEQPGMALTQVRLLRKRALLGEAEVLLKARLALQLAAGERVALMLEHARIALQRHELPLARELIEQVRESVATGEVDAQVLPAALALQLRLLHFGDESSRLLAVVEQIERLACLPQDAAPLAIAACFRARALLAQGLPELAFQEGQRAARLAEAHGAAEAASEAYRVMVLFAADEHRFESALQHARRGIALAPACGDLYVHDGARAQYVLALTDTGQLSSAATQREHGALGSESALAQYNHELTGSALAWRLGDAQAALRYIEALMERYQHRNAPQLSLAYWQACFSLGVGREATAQALLENAGDRLTDVQQALLKSGIYVLQGDREAAKRSLRRACATHRKGSALKLSSVIMSLAWLQIEDGESKGLAELLASLEPLRDEHPVQPLLLAAQQCRQRAQLPDPELWARLTERCCGLRNRHAWLLAPEGLAEWMRGQRRLSEPLHLAWF